MSVRSLDLSAKGADGNRNDVDIEELVGNGNGDDELNLDFDDEIEKALGKADHESLEEIQNAVQNEASTPSAQSSATSSAEKAKKIAAETKVNTDADADDGNANTETDDASASSPKAATPKAKVSRVVKPKSANATQTQAATKSSTPASAAAAAVPSVKSKKAEEKSKSSAIVSSSTPKAAKSLAWPANNAQHTVAKPAPVPAPAPAPVVKQATPTATSASSSTSTNAPSPSASVSASPSSASAASKKSSRALFAANAPITIKGGKNKPAASAATASAIATDAQSQAQTSTQAETPRGEVSGPTPTAAPAAPSADVTHEKKEKKKKESVIKAERAVHTGKKEDKTIDKAKTKEAAPITDTVAADEKISEPAKAEAEKEEKEKEKEKEKDDTAKAHVEDTETEEDGKTEEQAAEAEDGEKLVQEDAAGADEDGGETEPAAESVADKKKGRKGKRAELSKRISTVPAAIVAHRRTSDENRPQSAQKKSQPTPSSAATNVAASTPKTAATPKLNRTTSQGTPSAQKKEKEKDKEKDKDKEKEKEQKEKKGTGPRTGGKKKAKLPTDTNGTPPKPTPNTSTKVEDKSNEDAKESEEKPQASAPFQLSVTVSSPAADSVGSGATISTLVLPSASTPASASASVSGEPPAVTSTPPTRARSSTPTPIPVPTATPTPSSPPLTALDFAQLSIQYRQLDKQKSEWTAKEKEYETRLQTLEKQCSDYKSQLHSELAKNALGAAATTDTAALRGKYATMKLQLQEKDAQVKAHQAEMEANELRLKGEFNKKLEKYMEEWKARIHGLQTAQQQQLSDGSLGVSAAAKKHTSSGSNAEALRKLDSLGYKEMSEEKKKEEEDRVLREQNAVQRFTLNMEIAREAKAVEHINAINEQVVCPCCEASIKVHFEKKDEDDKSRLAQSGLQYAYHRTVVMTEPPRVIFSHRSSLSMPVPLSETAEKIIQDAMDRAKEIQQIRKESVVAIQPPPPAPIPKPVTEEKSVQTVEEEKEDKVEVEVAPVAVEVKVEIEQKRKKSSTADLLTAEVNSLTKECLEWKTKFSELDASYKQLLRVQETMQASIKESAREPVPESHSQNEMNEKQMSAVRELISSSSQLFPEVPFTTTKASTSLSELIRAGAMKSNEVIVPTALKNSDLLSAPLSSSTILLAALFRAQLQASSVVHSFALVFQSKFAAYEQRLKSMTASVNELKASVKSLKAFYESRLADSEGLLKQAHVLLAESESNQEKAIDRESRELIERIMKRSGAGSLERLVETALNFGRLSGMIPMLNFVERMQGRPMKVQLRPQDVSGWMTGRQLIDSQSEFIKLLLDTPDLTVISPSSGVTLSPAPGAHSTLSVSSADAASASLQGEKLKSWIDRVRSDEHQRPSFSPPMVLQAPASKSIFACGGGSSKKQDLESPASAGVAELLESYQKALSESLKRLLESCFLFRSQARALHVRSMRKSFEKNVTERTMNIFKKGQRPSISKEAKNDEDKEKKHYSQPQHQQQPSAVNLQVVLHTPNGWRDPQPNKAESVQQATGQLPLSEHEEQKAKAAVDPTPESVIGQQANQRPSNSSVSSAAPPPPPRPAGGHRTGNGTRRSVSNVSSVSKEKDKDKDKEKEVEKKQQHEAEEELHTTI